MTSLCCRYAALVVICVGASGCAGVPRPPLVESRSPMSPQGIVLVVDGAGGVEEATKALDAAVEETRTPLSIRIFDWTHGLGRGLVDMTDVEHARAQGRRLAALIVRYRSTCPQTPIYVLAYSAGTHVALESARWLAPNSLERMVLLAPAVAADYDLRPALAAARLGVDAFTSRRDRVYLGLGTRAVGTADGKFGVPPAGRVGFDEPPWSGADAYLAQRLRQHPWEPSFAASGNLGGHGGSLRSAFFRQRVLPMLTCRTVTPT